MQVGNFEITPQSGGSGTNVISFQLTAINPGLDASYVIRGVAGSATADMMLTSVGAREEFNGSDGSFTLIDEGTFNVLKP